jgi:hypothetical protein
MSNIQRRVERGEPVREGFEPSFSFSLRSDRFSLVDEHRKTLLDKVGRYALGLCHYAKRARAAPCIM